MSKMATLANLRNLYDSQARERNAIVRNDPGAVY